MSGLGVGIIGLGVGVRHLQGFESHPDCRVTALCDIDPAKEKWAAQNHPECTFYRNAFDLIADPEVDIVSVASFDDVHYAQACAALKAGKHLFVEKPVCQRSGELAELRELSEKRPSLGISSNLVLRLSPRFLWLKEQIEQEFMGRVYYMEGDYNYGRIEKIVDGWRGGLDYYSVIQGGSIHLIDLMIWLSGDLPAEVSVMGNRVSTENTRFRFNDLAVGLVRFKSGMLAKIGANFACVMPHFHNLVVFGSKATFLNDLPEARLYTSREKDSEFQAVDKAYRSNSQGDLIYSFVDYIVNGTRPVVSAEDVFKSMSVCLAMDEAMDKPGPVPVIYY